MLLATELVPSSQVSTRDVSYPSPSHNIPLDQYQVIRNVSGVPFEPEKNSVAKAKVFISVNDGQKAISTRERELIERLLMRWGGTIARALWLWLLLGERLVWWMMKIIDLKKEKRLSEARYQVSDRWHPVLDYGLLSYRVAVC